MLVGLMQKCAPRTDVRTLAAIVSVESGGDAWAVRDPSSPVGVHPATYAQAVTLAHGILVRGGRVALGLSQVLLPRRGLDSATLLGSPCANLRAGSAILAANYREQLRYVFAPDSSSGQQAALRRALSEYNSGSPTGAPEYTQLVLDAVLASDRYADAVRADEAKARAYGISGVPFFVVDAKFAISGAQPADLVLQALEQAWADRPPLTLVHAGGPGCEGDACVV